MHDSFLSLVSRWVGIAMLGGLLAALLLAGRSDNSAQRAFIQQAVERAVVQCYALEGAYPPNIAYVQEHYGLRVDEERYLIHYRVEGENLRPEILVIER